MHPADLQKHLLPETPDIWKGFMDSQFGGQDLAPGQAKVEQCAFVFGPRSSPKVVVCDIEGLQHYDGQDKYEEVCLRAVQGICPECETPFRIDPTKSPCLIEDERVPFQTADGMVYMRPLTVFVPVKCNASVAALNDAGQVIGTGECTWNVIIRRGRAMNLDEVRATLPQAITAAQQAYTQTWQWLHQQRANPQYAQSIVAAWQGALPSIQRIQTGQYERQGPNSLVGCWDRVDHVINTCQACVSSVQGNK